MSHTVAVSLSSFTTFGELLRYLRRRARLQQRDLAIAVGYSEGQICRLEQNQRLPDLPTLAARFVPALELEDAPELAARLLDLAPPRGKPNLRPFQNTLTSLDQHRPPIRRLGRRRATRPSPANAWATCPRRSRR